jgi:toxin ParE1/3/4
LTEVAFGNEALEDLVALEDHLFARSERVADRVLRRILERCGQLAHDPEVGRRRPDIASDARSLAAERWVTLYRFRSSGGVVIVRVVDGRRDLKALHWPAVEKP